MNYRELSKEISYALRHAPWEYELELDPNGWVLIKQLIDSFNLDRKWINLTLSDIEEMINKSEKKRHEIFDNKIRALYGHSTPNKIVLEKAEPPDVLYHGTARRFVDRINQEGLLPMGRQYVHLSVDFKTAQIVGKRRDSIPIILQINAKKASNEGVKFYNGNDNIWLSDTIGAKYIDIS
jgi:putative RNA 2'-phosphotransferase